MIKQLKASETGKKVIHILNYAQFHLIHIIQYYLHLFLY